MKLNNITGLVCNLLKLKECSLRARSVGGLGKCSRVRANLTKPPPPQKKGPFTHSKKNVVLKLIVQKDIHEFGKDDCSSIRLFNKETNL